MASPYAALAQRGLDCASIAVAKDIAGDYQNAREMYFEAAEILFKLSEYELDDSRRDAYRNKAAGYLTRMEELNKLLGVKAPAPGEVLEQWVRKEIMADKIMKNAVEEHQESHFREALKEYLRALSMFSDASVNADQEGQTRLMDKWVKCEATARTLSNAMGLKNFNPGRKPSTVVLKKPDPPPDFPAAPSGLPPPGTDDGGSSGGGGGGGAPTLSVPAPSKDDDSFEALQARLKNLRS
mmetsp:Transcript_109910/g.154106  ORF Transcript_109910/g.154106 Transcript_109910/m.154106 type:complete len:239 (+) Transcript_109910:191-907(+)